MEPKTAAPLDAAALRALLDEREGELTGILLRLAWEAGLKRAEILSLKWEQVDFERRRLRLGDRIVPLSASAASALERWRERLPETEYVASSPRTGKPVAGSSASAAAREALDAAGLTGARLEDLRADYIRRAAAARGDGFALRVSGSRRLLAASAAPEKPAAPDVRARLWSVMQSNRRGAAAVALWLSEQAGVRGRELTELTWEQVELERGVLHLERGDVMLIQELIDVLRREKESRGGGDDPHVIRLPSTGRGVTSGQLSAMLRELLMKNGLEDLRLGALRREEQAERDREAIRRLVRRSGSVTRRQAAELLGIPESTAAERLRALLEAGEL
ncbi:MAG: tyrosine-type recombinase/integrase, partial [Oscillospiraceae bacterium]|nr:tyrosine-type recombinase/integrase [Oscillospiraceae bacterium]